MVPDVGFDLFMTDIDKHFHMISIQPTSEQVVDNMVGQIMSTLEDIDDTYKLTPTTTKEDSRLKRGCQGREFKCATRQCFGREYSIKYIWARQHDPCC